MTRLERFYFISLFGGGKPLDYVSMIQIGTLHLANPVNRNDIYPGSRTFLNATSYQKVFENLLQEALEYGWIKRVDTDKVLNIRKVSIPPPGCYVTYTVDPADFGYQITEKGDLILREEQMDRAGATGYYKYFNRQVDSKYQDNIKLPDER